MNDDYYYLKNKEKTLFRYIVLLLIVGIVSAIVSVAFVFASLESIGVRNKSISFIPIIIVLAIVSIISFVLVHFIDKQRVQYSKMARIAKGDASNEDELKRLIREERAAREAEQYKREQEIYKAQHPQCPACNGFNTQRISTTKRIVHIGVVGLASSTIGKQYECLDCQHKW